MGGTGSIEATRRGEAGLTLVEMLVVLAIIAVMAGAVSIGVGSITRAPSAEAEARRLAARLQAAADDGMLGDRMIAFTAAKNGYGFATIGTNGALVARTDDAFGFHRLPAGMVVTLDVRPPVILGVDGGGRPLSALIESGDQRWRVTYDGLTATAAPAPTA